MGPLSYVPGSFRRAMLAALFSCLVVPDGLPAQGRPPSISERERELVVLREQARLLEDVLEDLEADPSREFVFLIEARREPVLGEEDEWVVPPVLVSAEELVRWETWRYLGSLLHTNQAFSQQALAALLRYARTLSANTKAQLPGRLADLRRRIRKAEDELAELSTARPGVATPGTAPAPAPGSARRGQLCVEFVGVTRIGPLSAGVDVSTDPNTLHHSWQSPRGWPGDVTMQWTRPPAWVCDGDTVTFESLVTNNRPYAQDPGGTAGHLDFKPTSYTTMTCSNPDAADPPSDVWVRAPERGRVNRCTAQVRVVGFNAAAPLFQAGFSAGLTGQIHYNYKRREE